MSCAECERERDNPQGVYYVRINGANVGLLGCRVHVAELIRRLNAYGELVSGVPGAYERLVSEQPPRIGDLPEPS